MECMRMATLVYSIVFLNNLNSFLFRNSIYRVLFVLCGGGSMREVTKLLINEFKIKELGFDFMGYYLQKGDIYTFHHLIVPNRHNGPVARWNGSILFSTPHNYLHGAIEQRDYDMFCYITSEMVDMNMKGYLDMENIRHIHEVLCQFEREHCGDRTRKGKLLIKEEYTRRMLKR